MTSVIVAALTSVGLPFTDVHVTESINTLPSTFGQLAAEGMFPAEGGTTRTVEIDIENDIITALPVTPSGSPSTRDRKGSETAIFFKIPNTSHQHTLLPEDIEGMLAKAARTRKPATLASELNKHLLKLRKKFDITLELERMGALKGVIVDGAGTELYNLFDAFEITQTVVAFDLGNANANVLDKCEQVIGTMEDNLSDEVMTGVAMRVDRNFFTKLITHPNVEKYWLHYQAAQALANPTRGTDGTYRPRSFAFGNIQFQEYSANVPMFDGTMQRIVGTDTGHAYPTGTMDSHVTYAAPPRDIRELTGAEAAAGSDDDLLHVTTELLKHGAGVELKGQMNALPLWRRPKLLVKAVAGAS